MIKAILRFDTSDDDIGNLAQIHTPSLPDNLFIPAVIEVEPKRLQGEWIKVKEERMSVDMSGEIVTRYKCSKCGRVIATFPSKLEDYYPFCHCGADMRGGMK